MKNKPVILILLLWILIGVFIGVSCGRDNRQIGLDEPVGSGIFVDYPKGYYSISELSADAMLIAVGRIDRTVEVGPDEATHGGLSYTKSAFRLDKVLKGKATREVIVVQGGAIGQAEDVASPVFRPGERCVLFLKTTTEGETYYVLGPWGRYRIVDNKVYSMNYVVKNRGYYEAPPGLNFNGVELDTFVKNITELLDKVRFTADSAHLRFDVGSFGKTDVIFSTGKYGPGKVSYTIHRVEGQNGESQIAMPEGMEVSVEPNGFTAYPYQDYKSTLEVSTAPDITPGDYLISVEYSFENFAQGNYQFAIHVMPSNISE